MTIPRMTEKRRAKLAAEGNPFPFSTITKKATKQVKRSPIKKRKRSASEKARIYGTDAHIAWLKSKPCAFCGLGGYSEVAHTRTGGTGKKAGWETTIPACGPHPVVTRYMLEGLPVSKLVDGCHKTHDDNKRTWREKFDTDALAAKYAAEWLALSGETP